MQVFRQPTFAFHSAQVMCVLFMFYSALEPVLTSRAIRKSLRPSAPFMRSSEISRYRCCSKGTKWNAF